MPIVEKTIGAYRAGKATDDALAAIASGVDTLKSLEKLLEEKFPYAANELSKAEADFAGKIASELEGGNSILAAAIPPSRDAISHCISNIQKLELCIMLAIPPMEDGNNFGVGVQQFVAKYLKETREKLVKNLEVIPTYYDSRAGAVEKLSGLPKTSFSVTTTKTKSESSGGKDGPEDKTSTNVAEEEKKTGSASAAEVVGLSGNAGRVKHIVALDVQFYAQLRSILVDMTSEYASIVDVMEKNYDKISMPKGSSEGRNMMSMF